MPIFHAVAKHRTTKVELEAQEVKQRSAEVEKKMRQLATQISNPEKYFKPKDERSQSAVERFRRYFTFEHSKSIEKKRKPTRAEVRIQRNRTIAWMLLAFICLIWVVLKLSQILRD